MLHLSLLWHMHQPWYLDPASGRLALPWVRLHATKDYLDMVELVREFPEIRVHFNLTPSLLEQLELYGQGVRDEHQLLSEKPADALTPEEIARLLETGFMGQPERMVHPYPRYFELMAKAGRRQPLSTQELRDLQVWSNLSWMDPRWCREDPFLKGLSAKGSHYSEEEKRRLLEVQLELLKRVIPAYRLLQEEGRAELTTSPWSHPILPLLLDTGIARQTNPGMPLPANPFQFPEDVSWHLKSAQERYSRWFGRPPEGLWPSEGSVSEGILPAVQEAGFRWLATDEEILWKSLGQQALFPALYQPYRVRAGEGSLALLFRDHTLSDLIGFVYSGWPAEQASADFLQRLKSIEAKADPKAPPPIVLVALDGENAWESYPGDGEPFLRALYKGLRETPWIRCSTVSEYLKAYPPQQELKGLAAGSWIRGEFSTWIGHEPQNQAWEELARVRRLVGLEECRSIPIAQGSDWFWWLGPEHHSPEDPIFDRLFRSHLKAAYQAAGRKPPARLEEPFKQELLKPIAAPTRFFTPLLDGEVTSYFEWLHAGEADLTHTGSAMARARPLLTRLWWGFDGSSLYIRLDPSRPLSEWSCQMTLRERRFQVELVFDRGAGVKGRGSLIKADGSLEPLTVPFPVAARRIVELGLPLAPVGLSAGDLLEVTISIEQEGLVLERYPEFGKLVLAPPQSAAAAQLWSA
ncbi:MAG: glycoside hydrolase [Candidatus Omnitrophica bacterium]|nr:glycoside hydrolase [Candidatus Omnitrophota bacterium]